MTSTQAIFVFTAGDASARSHLSDSITNPVLLERVVGFFEPDEQRQLREIDAEHGLYAWGAIPGAQNTPRWNQMNEGDWVLCVYGSHYRFVAQVLRKFDNEQFAKAVWGVTSENKTWQLIYFLTKPVAINRSVSDLKDYLNGGYMGSTKIGAEKIQLIAEQFGSVQSFIDATLIRNAIDAQSSEHPLDQITEADVLDALLQIDSGQMFGFAPSTDYDLLYQERRYPPKAAAGIATKRTLGRVLRPDEFQGGIGSRCFKRLEKLGFQIVSKTEPEQYFLLRSNVDSRYQDELGVVYRFNSNVPNHKRLQHGGLVVVDTKTNQGPRVIGYGHLKPATVQVRDDGSKDYTAEFSEWQAFESMREMSVRAQQLLQQQPGYNVQHAVRPIQSELYKLLISNDSSERGAVMTNPNLTPFGIEEALDDLLMPKIFFEEMVESLRVKKNLILQGPPGTGKSFVAKRLAYFLLGHRDVERVQSIQFHQSFSYEDFIQGFRPQKDSNGFTLRDGVFYRFCMKARSNPDQPYVFMIDEINRGNLSKIFGEVMLLIEADKRGDDWAVSLTYSDEGDQRFYIPKNVYILGMMNTADRSLAIVDYALRRRFAFRDLEPAFDSPAFAPLLSQKGVAYQVIQIIQNRIGELNRKIYESPDLGKGFAIGHSFFVPTETIGDSVRWYNRVISDEIAPLLREYWFDKKQSEVDQEIELLVLR